MVFMLAGAAIGAVSSIFGARDAAKRQREQIKANRAAAKLKYSAILDSTNIMKAAVRESTKNAAQEAFRVGAAQGREVDQQIASEIGKLQAQSEGLTSGRSKGRHMIDTIVKGNQISAQVKDRTVSMVNQLIEVQDAKTNEYNNRLLQSYQEMSAILSSEGPDLGSNVGGFLSGTIGGASSGLALEQALR